MRRHVKATSAIAVICGIALCLCASSALAAKGVVGFFGERGASGGQFIWGTSDGGPAGAAINQTGSGGAASGDVYVVDRDNNRVQQFSSAGTFKRAFGLDVGGAGVNVCTVAASCAAGTASAAAGGMSSPQGIAIEESTGNVYVTDQGNRRVDVFTAEGIFEGAFGRKVAVTGAAEELQLCTVATGCQAGISGANPGQFGAAIGYLALSPLNGHVLVADKTNRRVQEFEPTITAGAITAISLVRTFGVAGTEPGQFGVNSPADVAVDSSGKIYAVDPGNNRVQSFNSSGASPEIFAAAQLSGEPAPLNLTVDSANDNVLVVKPCSAAVCSEAAVPNERRLLEFNEAGMLLETHSENAGITSVNGIAAVSGGGVIYMTSNEGPGGPGVFVLGSPLIPPTASIDPVSTATGTAATFSGHVNPHGYPTDYHFEYSSDGVRWTKLPDPDVVVGADTTDHAVSQEATGLEALTTYQVRLVATKPFGAGSASAETSFTTPASPPVLSGAGVDEISDTKATFKSQVNAENQQTEYHFEYVTQAQFEASGYAEATSLPTPEGTVSGGSLTEVTAQATTLRVATAYRFRLIAASPAGSTIGTEVAFATYSPAFAGLPDGRAYEQATPVEKNGNSVHRGFGRVMTSPNGDGITYHVDGSFPGAEGAQDPQIYLALRGPDTWTSQGLLAPAALGSVSTVVGLSSDLSRDYIAAAVPRVENGIYERNTHTRQLTPVYTEQSSLFNPRASYAGSSDDDSKALFEIPVALQPGAATARNAPNVYLWNADAHQLTLAGVLNEGQAPATGTFAGSYDWWLSSTTSGGPNANYYSAAQHVLSGDGSRAFFTARTSGKLYVRLNPTQPQSAMSGSTCTEPEQACTIEISQSVRSTPDPNGPQPAAFVGASKDGKQAFFLSKSELTDDANTGGDKAFDLYRYDTATRTLSDVAPTSVAENPLGANVAGVIGISDDGSYVYFAAGGALAPGASVADCSPGRNQTGTACNLYVWHNGTISFITKINTTGSNVTPVIRNWEPALNGSVPLPKTSRLTPDGKTMIFTSSDNLTGFDDHGYFELYRYRAGEPGVTCVSCLRTQQAPTGDATLETTDAGIVPLIRSYYFTRNLSANGNRIFFNSEDKLVASDTNGVSDVYEWEADGTGSCATAADDGGCLYLISSGISAQPSQYGDASESGDDVYFFTAEPLVGQDDDELVDVYDARVGGGLAAQNSPAVTNCTGEACLPQTGMSPQRQSAGSSTFSGPPNPKTHRRHRKKRRPARKKHGKHARHHQSGRSHR